MKGLGRSECDAVNGVQWGVERPHENCLLRDAKTPSQFCFLHQAPTTRASFLPLNPLEDAQPQCF